MKKLKCKRCGHEWIPRTEHPATCPNIHCHSTKWDKARGKNELGRKPKREVQ